MTMNVTSDSRISQKTKTIVLGVMLGIAAIILIVIVCLIIRCLIRKKRKRNAIRNRNQETPQDPSVHRPIPGSESQAAQPDPLITHSSKQIIQSQSFHTNGEHQNIATNHQLFQPVMVDMNNVPLDDVPNEQGTNRNPKSNTASDTVCAMD